MSNIETKALQWIIAGLDSPLIGQGSDIIKGLLAEINRLKGEMEDKDKVIKLLQGHCNALMDTEGKLAQWKKGHTAGQESAGFEVQRYDEVIRQLRKELSDENANFTEEIIELERQLAEARQEAAMECLEIINNEADDEHVVYVIKEIKAKFKLEG